MKLVSTRSSVSRKNVFCGSLGALLIALCLPVQAQQRKVSHVGVLAPPGRIEEHVSIQGLRDGLNETGHPHGKNLVLDTPSVKTYDELRSIVKAYVERKVDVIVTQGGTATAIAMRATTEIPIVFIRGMPDPVQAGLVKSLARPGTNITGVSSFVGREIHGKRLELFKDLLPSLRSVAILFNARGENPSHAENIRLVREVASKLGLMLIEKPTKSGSDIDEALRSLSKQIADGILVISSGLFLEPCKRMAAVAMQKKLPLSGCEVEGALFSYSPDVYRIGYRAAWYVDKILKGTKPEDLPIEAPKDFELVINLKTAKQIGLTIPPHVLARADRVVK